MNEESLLNADYSAGNAIGAAQSAPALSVDKKAILNLEDRLNKRIIGQHEAIAVISRALKRSMAGLRNPERPIGSFIFTGASGTGKTELCRALAEILYGHKSKLIKLDMSEYASRWDVNRLIGCPSGYIGYENGGLLTNMVKNNPKGAVLCLDETEKAHSDIFNTFLQVLDDGRLTSGQGETVSFANILIIMTCNIGSDMVTGDVNMIGFTGDDKQEADINKRINEALRKTFKPEFLNRITNIVTFNPLTKKDMTKICGLMLKDLTAKMKRIGIGISFDNKAVIELSRLGYNRTYNARELQRTITAYIEDRLADMILDGEVIAGDSLNVTFSGTGFVIKKKKKNETRTNLRKEIL